MKKKSKKYLSFFSGALGLDIGLEEMGFEPLMYNDNDKHVIATISKNHPEVPLYDCDISELSKERLYKELNIKDGDIFLMAGGPPCQPYSTMGKRLARQDDRSNALLEYIRLIKEIQPDYFILENVRGLYSAKLDDEKAPKGSLLKDLISLFKDTPYEINFNLYDASLYGVPQKRERFVMIGSLHGKVPTLHPTHEEPRTLRQALTGLSGVQEHKKYSKKRLETFKLLREGQNWKNLPKEIQKEVMGKSLKNGGGRTGFYRRLAWDKPAPTLLTSPDQTATGFCHPEKDRPLSIQEYARLQTFPDSFDFQGTTDAKYKQIGNAVPCDFGKLLGEHILQHFEDPDKIVPYYGKTSRYNNTGLSEWLAEYNNNYGKKQKK